MKRVVMADLFCGGGGTSEGAREAFEEANLDYELTAINHWDLAIATHSANHPKARHLCASLDSLNPFDLFRPGELSILWGSPECLGHSRARGGQPASDQSRATGWCIIRWAEALRPPIILVENVRELLEWGPLDSRGRPLKSRKGETFRAWWNCLKSLGYDLDYRILCAANYGDFTTRERLYIMGVRGRRKIVWPDPTHAENAEPDLFGRKLQPWRSAREIIDWSLSGTSVYERPRPLAPKTMNRILLGFEKFTLPKLRELGVQVVLDPFLVKMRGTCNAAPIDEPVPTVTAGGNNLAIAQPFLIEVAHGASANDSHRAHSIDGPIPTITCGHKNGDGRSLALCQPFLMTIDQQSNPGGVAEPDKPLSTITTKARHAICQPCLVPDQPPTPDCEAFITKYYSNGGQWQTIDEPLGTVTTKARFGLVQPVVKRDGRRYKVDFLFRMVNWRELAQAQGFPSTYRFAGKKVAEKVKQIGNANPVKTSKALIKAALTQL